MENIIQMGRVPFAIVCTPFSVCGTILNLFCIFCLWKPAVGVSVRQPLHLLLGAILGNSTFLQLIGIISVTLPFFSPPELILVSNVTLMFQAYGSSFSINAWISIFYYMKIVPQHWKFYVWVKKNIKGVVFAGFIVDQTLLLSALSMGAAAYMIPSPGNALNETVLKGNTVLNGPLYQVATRMFMVYLICPSITLTISWGRTFCYLNRHIKRMKEATGSSSHAQQKNHMRVTIMGIVQTALFIPTSIYAMAMACLFSSYYETLDSDKHITMTVMCMSNLANVICLGVSQSVFRLRAIALLRRAKKAFGLVER